MLVAEPLAIRILTHNIRYATSSPEPGERPWAARRALVVGELLFHTARCPETILAAQEVLHHQLLDLLAGLNHRVRRWSYVGVGRDDGHQQGEYSPLLYQPEIWSLVDSGTSWLSPSPARPSKGWDAASIRIVTWAKLQHRASKRRLLVLNTHLDDQGAVSRLEGVKLIVRLARVLSATGPARWPTLLTGDFNSAPTQEAYQQITSQHDFPFADTALFNRVISYGNEDTFTGFSKQDQHQRIDFIMFHQEDRPSDQQWEVETHAVLPNKFDDGVYISDHRAVMADLRLL